MNVWLDESVGDKLKGEPSRDQKRCGRGVALFGDTQKTFKFNPRFCLWICASVASAATLRVAGRDAGMAQDRPKGLIRPNRKK